MCSNVSKDPQVEKEKKNKEERGVGWWGGGVGVMKRLQCNPGKSPRLISP